MKVSDRGAGREERRSPRGTTPAGDFYALVVSEISGGMSPTRGFAGRWLEVVKVPVGGNGSEHESDYHSTITPFGSCVTLPTYPL